MVQLIQFHQKTVAFQHLFAIPALARTPSGQQLCIQDFQCNADASVCARKHSALFAIDLQSVGVDFSCKLHNHDNNTCQRKKSIVTVYYYYY